MKDNLDAISAQMLEAINKFRALPVRYRQALFINCLMIFDKVFCDYVGNEKRDHEYVVSGEVLRYGYPIFIRFFYDPAFEDLEGVPLQALNSERLHLCKTLIAACKTFGWIEDIKEHIKYGDFKKKDFGKHTRIKFAKKHHWNEYLDKQNNLIYSNIVSIALQKQYDELEQRKDFILAQMNKHVYVWRDSFMGYTTDIEIEDFFYTHAELDAKQETEWDMFHECDSFGGVRYSDYVKSIVDFSCAAIKHIYFAHILKSKRPDLSIENFFYLCREKTDLISLISENRTIPLKDATVVYNGLTLGKHNSNLYSTPMYCASPFIAISETQTLQSIAGTLYSPFAFMLENIHHAYPKEWDTNTRHREDIFKKDLYFIFRDKKFTCVERTVNIPNTGSRKTDIDAVVVDKSSGEIALFQLKWQDHVYTSTRSLYSKSANYNENVNKWLACVREWIDSATSAEISSVLGIPQKYIDKANIYLFVLGRNHGNYSGDAPLDANCACGQWYQFLRVSQNLDGTTPKLSQIYNRIRETSPFRQRYKEKPILYRIGKYRIVFGNWIFLKKRVASCRCKRRLR